MSKVRTSLILAFCFMCAGLALIFYIGNGKNNQKTVAQTENGVVAGANTDQGSDYIARLAQSLKDEGAVVYCSKGLDECKKQFELFGDSQKYLDTVECDSNQADANVDECTAHQVDVYPTWVYKGTSIEGVQTLSQLAQMIGFSQK